MAAFKFVPTSNPPAGREEVAIKHLGKPVYLGKGDETFLCECGATILEHCSEEEICHRSGLGQPLIRLTFECGLCNRWNTLEAVDSE
jgi:hypothetical protein